MDEQEFDVIVVGGGAAGMMAAGRAAELGKSVLLLEGNARLGEKLRISGGGRCNITNAEPDTKKLLSHYGEAELFLHSPFSKFGVSETFSFFEGRGVPLKIEARNRVFPISDSAADVVSALERYMQESGVEMRTGSTVESLEGKDGWITRVVTKKGSFVPHSLILATGGLSRPKTGSTGDGFGWLRALGHTVKRPTPTIVPLKVKERWVKDSAGISIPEAKLGFYVDGVRKLVRTGPLLFTHFGISGPTVLNAAGEVKDLLHEGKVEARIDLFPEMDLGILDQHLTSVFDRNKNRLLRNALKEIAPPGMPEVILSLVPSLDPNKKVHSVLREERRSLATLLKSISLTVTGLMGFEKAVVADGGLVLDEVDLRTMRSKRFSNLFVTGDLLHITRPSGGYSLQLCWTTGYVAGSNA